MTLIFRKCPLHLGVKLLYRPWCKQSEWLPSSDYADWCSYHVSIDITRSCYEKLIQQLLQGICDLVFGIELHCTLLELFILHLRKFSSSSTSTGLGKTLSLLCHDWWWSCKSDMRARSVRVFMWSCDQIGLVVMVTSQRQARIANSSCLCREEPLLWSAS